MYKLNKISELLGEFTVTSNDGIVSIEFLGEFYYGATLEFALESVYEKQFSHVSI